MATAGFNKFFNLKIEIIFFCQGNYFSSMASITSGLIPSVISLPAGIIKWTNIS